MTDEQINAEIAEACPDKFRDEDGVWFFQYAKDCWSQCHNNSICSDLNAMHQAEKTIYNHNNLWTAYYYQIGAGPFSLHATARKKAEAFLRIHGKWKEEQK